MGGRSEKQKGKKTSKNYSRTQKTTVVLPVMVLALVLLAVMLQCSRAEEQVTVKRMVAHWLPTGLLDLNAFHATTGVHPAQEASARAMRDTPYLRINKEHMLDTLELRIAAEASGMLGPGKSLLDIGAASCEMGMYLERKYRMNISCYDKVPVELNKYSHNENYDIRRHEVHIFDGKCLPNEPNMSYDTVTFNSVLHHAANDTYNLLKGSRALE